MTPAPSQPDAAGRFARPPWWVKLVLGSSGLALVALVEIALRLSGVAREPLPGHDAATLFVRQDVDGRVVHRIADALCPEPFNRVALAAERAPGGVRIVVLGGSDVYGYPRDQASAFPRWLELRLARALPGRQIEVVNLGAMSYGSGRLVGVAREVLEIGCDVLVVATGNNEYVERRLRESNSMGDSWVARRAADLRLVRVLVRALPTGDVAPVTSLAERGQVLRDVMPRNAGVDQQVHSDLEGNLESIIELAEARGVPVVISNVPTNLRDWSPQAAAASRPLSAAESTRFAGHLAAGDRAMALGDPQAAIRAYVEALGIDAGHAGLRFALGRARLAVGDRLGARDDFVAARDADRRPIRATSEILAILARVARAEGLPFVNADAAFSAAAHGIPGNDLFVDYCHPTVDGQRLWAKTMAETLAASGVLGPAEDWVNDEAAIVAAEEEALKTLPNDESVEFMTAFAAGFAAARAGDRQAALAAYDEAVRLDRSAYDAYYNRAIQLLALGRIDEAIADCQRTIALRPDHYQARGNLGAALVDAGRAAEAIPILQEALALNEDYVRALVSLGKAYDMTADAAAAAAAFDRAILLEPNDVGARLARAVFSANHGDTPGARADLEHVLAIDPGNQAARSVLGQLPR